jgi:thiosulfate/3-mercaptopyruvate sulfurtransferase
MNFTALVDVQSLAELMQRSRAVVIDCRFDLQDPGAGRQAYQAAHIPGARFADLNRDLSGPVTAHSGRHPLPAPDVLAERFGALGIGNGSPVVVYDQANGTFAARAWWLLRWLGHRRVAVLDGGFKAWVAAGGAVESQEPPPSPQRFVPRVDAAATLSSAEVLSAVRDPRRLLVDARAAERFWGTVEPLDPVAGHVPGAVNHPCTTNVDPATGCFLPTDVLRKRWRERLGSIAPDHVILMCGSGVTACHNLLAMEVAGLTGARLYAGSWSEWIRDPERPVARGPASAN